MAQGIIPIGFKNLDFFQVGIFALLRAETPFLKYAD
jgi:hypothetical protein